MEAPAAAIVESSGTTAVESPGSTAASMETASTAYNVPVRPRKRRGRHRGQSEQRDHEVYPTHRNLLGWALIRTDPAQRLFPFQSPHPTERNPRDERTDFFRELKPALLRVRK